MKQNYRMIRMSLLLFFVCNSLCISSFADTISVQNVLDAQVNRIYVDSVLVEPIKSKVVADTVLLVTQSAAKTTDTVEVKDAESRGALNLDRFGAPSVDKIITPSKIIWTIIFILLGYLFIGFISGVLNRIGERSARYRITVKRIVPIVKIVGWAFVTFIIIQGVIRPPLATVLAFFTSIGVAVAFAAQDLLKNIFGGLMILFDRPFQIGDKIEAGGSYGEVLKIGLRATRIVTADDSVVSVPNSDMMNNSISNSNSGENNCQVVAEIYLPIDVDTQKVRRIAIEAALVSKYIYLNKPVAVVFVNEMHQRKSIFKMRLKAYVSDIRYEFAFKSDMTEITLKELIKEGIISPDSF